MIEASLIETIAYYSTSSTNDCSLPDYVDLLEMIFPVISFILFHLGLYCNFQLKISENDSNGVWLLLNGG